MPLKPTVKLRTPELRAKQNRMSQSELAKRAGLSTTTVSNLESGRLKRIELETIAKLCLALSCTPSDLFEISGQEELDLLQRQKEALKKVIGTIKLDKAPHPDHLDADLAENINEELKRPR